MHFPDGDDERYQSRMTEGYRNPPRRLSDPSWQREMAEAFSQQQEEKRSRAPRGLRRHGRTSTTPEGG